MSLVTLVITLIVIGVLLWLFNKYVTSMDPTIKTIINIVVIVAVVIWVLSSFGLLDGLKAIRI